MGELKHGFGGGTLHGDDMKDGDETCFVLYMDDGKTLDLIGDKAVEYADVVSSGGPIMMMVRRTSVKNGTICPSIMILNYRNKS